MELLASPTPDARLREVSREELRRHADVNGEQHAQSDCSMRGFSMCRKPSPGMYCRRSSASSRRARRQFAKSQVRCCHEAGWCGSHSSEGVARFLGVTTPSTGDREALSSRGLRLDRSEENSRLLVTDTAAALEEESLWAGFDGYMAAVLDRAVRNVGQAAKKEAARLERRGRSDQNRLDVALRHLSSPLEREGAGGRDRRGSVAAGVSCRRARGGHRLQAAPRYRRSDACAIPSARSPAPQLCERGRSPSRVTGGSRMSARWWDDERPMAPPSRCCRCRRDATSCTTRSRAAESP